MSKALLKTLIKEMLLTESTPRHCAFYKASNGKWYMELAPNEYYDEEYGEGEYGDGERDTATTYGPFSSEDAAMAYLDNFSNPGSFYTDDSGKQPPPTKSPNGGPVKSPSGGSSFSSYGSEYGSYGSSYSSPSYSSSKPKAAAAPPPPPPPPAAKKPTVPEKPAAPAKPGGKKTTYKVYGRFGDSPACTRVKGKVYGAAKGTKFRAGMQAEVEPDGENLRVRDPATGHTQSWSKKESLERLIKDYVDLLT